MALLAEMEAITNRKILSECPDTFHHKYVALKEMFSKVSVLQQTGSAVQIPFQYRETNQGGWYDGSHTQLTVAKYSTIVGGYQAWSYLYIDEYINHQELCQNSGPEAFVDLMERRGSDIVQKAHRLLNSNTYSGTISSNEITGFAYWLVSTGTISQIDVSTYTTFASNLKTQTGGLSSMTKDDVNDLIADIYTDSGDPTCAFSDWDVWQRLQALTEGQVRYDDMNGKRNINAKYFEFGSTRFYHDRYATANKIYFIDPSTWRWIVNGPSATYGLAVQPWEKRNDYVNTKQKIVTWCGQLVCINPKNNGVYTITS